MNRKVTAESTKKSQSLNSYQSDPMHFVQKHSPLFVTPVVTSVFSQVLQLLQLIPTGTAYSSEF